MCKSGLIQSKRNCRAATRFFRKILKRQECTPRVLLTDQLASYGIAHRTVMPSALHRQSRYLNNRCENSYQPTRQRERAMKGFRSVGSAQRLLAAFSRISPHFRPPRHRMTATDYRTEIRTRIHVWHQATE
ncbi:DDE-type integrase/transposase/recombinase [Rhodococcus jostii]|uniref:DDE-type integrase/transposase/recombinase n=1 Tax=Rhodococcus jostii TaxID=132919 RepID=UPI0036452047